MGGNPCVKKVLQKGRDPRKLRGSPRRMWIEAITEDLVKVGAKDWRQKSKNCQDWKAILKKLEESAQNARERMLIRSNLWS
ncbi:hypothetical protein QE152_g22704 [Popillia japonica]|uniref:Uncharacterized protein n=1 Tax=Popillia japonica TaxID=7064 RepID=A0AAW1KJX9_POPJA